MLPQRILCIWEINGFHFYCVHQFFVFCAETYFTWYYFAFVELYFSQLYTNKAHFNFRGIIFLRFCEKSAKYMNNRCAKKICFTVSIFKILINLEKAYLFSHYRNNEKIGLNVWFLLHLMRKNIKCIKT